MCEDSPLKVNEDVMYVTYAYTYTFPFNPNAFILFMWSLSLDKPNLLTCILQMA